MVLQKEWWMLGNRFEEKQNGLNLKIISNCLIISVLFSQNKSDSREMSATKLVYCKCFE